MWPSFVTLYATILLIFTTSASQPERNARILTYRKTELVFRSFSRLIRFIRPCNQPYDRRYLLSTNVDAFYKPLSCRVRRLLRCCRPAVRSHALIVMADVSVKGMSAALLAANIHSLVRSLATTAPDVPALASRDEPASVPGIRPATGLPPQPSSCSTGRLEQS